MSEPLLVVSDLAKHFTVREGLLFQRSVSAVKAVDGVSFEIPEGKTLGLVGESGSGKSTTGYCVLQLIKPTGGSVRFMGKELTELPREQLRKLRRDMQIVFQDPYSSLDPRMTVGDIVAEPLIVHSSGSRRTRAARVRELLDVSIQAQILNLLKDLQDEFGLTYLFIAHDLAVVRSMSDQIAVMQSGKIVETGPAEEVYTRPVHEYTKSLLASVPIPDPREMEARKVERRRARAALAAG